MNSDPQLNVLLRTWKAPPVPGDFDQNVWRRIRMSQPEPVRPWWQAWVYSPIRLGAVAAMLALSLGGWAGLQGRPSPAPAFSFADGTTVTGAYLQLAKGVSP